METLEEEKEEVQSTTTYNGLAKISIPIEIMEVILSRLPVKSILRFRSLSKPWLSRISHPSFTKLHSTRTTTAFFISGHDYSTKKRYFFSAGRDGGPVTHIMTLDNVDPPYYGPAEHLNGLVLFTCLNQAFLVNPSTHKLFKIPVPDYFLTKYAKYTNLCFSFGFHESRNEHMILLIKPFCYDGKDTAEIMIFSMSSYSWRKVDVELPVGTNGWDQLNRYYHSHSVCVNSVVHFMLWNSACDILAFDLRSEEFLIFNIPEVRDKLETEPFSYIIKINGCLGVCQFRMLENNEMHIWILQDYENRVWVREIITIPKRFIQIDGGLPVHSSVKTDEIIFSSGDAFDNVLSVPIYNRKTGCFKSLQFTWGDHFQMTRSLWFSHIRCYVESMVPL